MIKAEKMFKSKRSRKYWLCLILFAIAVFSTSSILAQEEIKYQGLPPGEGVDLVLGNCVVCHSAEIILQNHMSRKSWDKTITWMQEKQGMWELDKGDRKKILDYLSKAQGVAGDRTQRKPVSKKSSPMYEFDYRPSPL